MQHTAEFILYINFFHFIYEIIFEEWVNNFTFLIWKKEKYNTVGENRWQTQIRSHKESSLILPKENISVPSSVSGGTNARTGHTSKTSHTLCNPHQNPHGDRSGLMQAVMQHYSRARADAKQVRRAVTW